MLCEAGREQKDMVSLLDRSVCEISRRVVGIDLSHVEIFRADCRKCSSLIVRTAGDYNAYLVMSADHSFFEEITRRMKRKSEISSKDVAIYTTEYYNMLCGFFVSHLNTYGHLKARFGIPELVSGYYPADFAKVSGGIRRCYDSSYGAVQIYAVGLPQING